MCVLNQFPCKAFEYCGPSIQHVTLCIALGSSEKKRKGKRGKKGTNVSSYQMIVVTEQVRRVERVYF